MQQLIVVRHGQPGPDGRLNDLGRAQIGALAEKLKPIINEASVAVLSWTTDRARESAEILGTAFGVRFEAHEILWSENSRPEDLPGALALVKSQRDKDVIILVTHYEYVEGFPAYFAEQELTTRLHPAMIGKGEAWVLDCLQKTLTHVA